MLRSRAMRGSSLTVVLINGTPKHARSRTQIFTSAVVALIAYLCIFLPLY